MFWSSWMFRDRPLSNYATNWIKTKLVHKIGWELWNKSIVKNPNRQFVSENHQPKNTLPVYWIIEVYTLGSLSPSKNYFFHLRRFFLNSIKTVFHNLNRMLLVLLETEYNKVLFTSIKNSIFKRHIIVVFDSIWKVSISHTVPYRWGPLCHSIGYIVTGCVKDTL